MPEHTLVHHSPATRCQDIVRRLPVRAALAALVALTLAGGVAVAAPTTRPAVPAASSAPLLPVPAAPVPAAPVVAATGPAACVGAGCRGRNPHTSGCDRDAVTVVASPLTTRAWSVPPAPDAPGGPTAPAVADGVPAAPAAPGAPAEVVVGQVEVRWSQSCRAGWALATATDSCAIGMLVVRRDDGDDEDRALPHRDGGAPSRGYTPMLDVRPGAGRLVGLVAPPDDGRGLVRDSTGFVGPLTTPR